ncbi:MAG TPA: hypothetical protein VK709_13445 [Candidatus Saccharimonadales bacterium]|nr:hypothetical protein [Candidatus Saccharimonadales bacterium]
MSRRNELKYKATQEAQRLQKEEGWTPQKVTVGKRYPNTSVIKAASLLGGLFSLHNGLPEVFLVLPNPTTKEIHSFLYGAVKFTTICQDRMLWLSVQFDDCLGYDGTYDIALNELSPAAQQALRCHELPYTETAPWTTLTLIDSASGVVRGLRQIVSAAFANRWLGTALEQMNSPLHRQEEMVWGKNIQTNYQPENIHLHPLAMTSKYGKP